MLQSPGVVDVNESRISETDLMAHALKDASNNKCSRMFVAKCSDEFVNEYARWDEVTDKFVDWGASNSNHLYGAFPKLFPFSKRGFEVVWPRNKPYKTHAWWSLKYQDRCFYKDLHFIFQVFGVLQKRKVCHSAKLQITKSQYKQHKIAIRYLKPADLLKVTGEERRKVPISNPAVWSLDELVSSLRMEVPGTDESCTAILQSQV